MVKNAGVPDDLSHPVSLGSSGPDEVRVIAPGEYHAMNGVKLVGFEGLTESDLLTVWGRDLQLSRELLGRESVDVRQVLLLVARQRNRALERATALERDLFTERQAHASPLDQPSLALLMGDLSWRDPEHLGELVMLALAQRDRAVDGMLRMSQGVEELLKMQRRAQEILRASEMPSTQGGAPIALRADDPTAAPQGGTDTAPVREDAAGEHGPTGAPTSPTNLTVNVVLNGKVSTPEDLASMLDALAQHAARRGSAP